MQSLSPFDNYDRPKLPQDLITTSPHSRSPNLSTSVPKEHIAIFSICSQYHQVKIPSQDRNLLA
jgi:hypothetical protein